MDLAHCFKSYFLAILLMLPLHHYFFSICLAKNATDIVSDQAALFTLRSHVSFDPNNILVNNWTSASSVCNWIGVTCTSTRQRVVALNLQGMALTGTIPPHLGNLSFLVRLNISDNNFHGELPEELVHLRRLRYLDLGLNDFGGKIPSWLGALPELKQLYLGNNSFTGAIPPSISNSSKLETLNMSRNFLQGRIPEEIAYLRNLKILSLRNNQLTHLIPLTIFNISNLHTLDLSYNGLNGSLPVDICHHLSSNLESLSLSGNELHGPITFSLKCFKLEVLSLSVNRFTGPIPSGLGNLTLLRRLYLGFNSLEGGVPNELGKLFNLELLALEKCRLAGHIPSGIFNISSLRTLYVPGNNFSGVLPRSICSRLSSVAEINFMDNQLTGSIPSDIGNCTVLQSIVFFKNSFTGVLPDSIGSLRNLEILIFDFNNLRGPVPSTFFNISSLRTLSFLDNHLAGYLPPSLGPGLPNLKDLFLDVNSFTGTIPDTISNASRLTRIDLSFNKFTGSIPHTLGKLRLLERLNLADNNFNGENSSTSELGFITSLTNCHHLTDLWISYNPLNGILPASFGNFSSSLQGFTASGCGIMGKLPENIGNVSNLVIFSVQQNHLVGSLPKTLQTLSDLQRFRVGGNSLHGSIPEDICSLKNLETLSLLENEFSGPLPACLGNVTSLRNLHLGSNKFTSDIPASLWNLKDLLTLDLSSNSFSGYLSPAVGSFRAAVILNLSSNQLHGQVPSTIGDMKTLISFSLAHNRFEGSIPDSFGKLISLEFLDLSHNDLSGMIPKSLEALLLLKSLNLSFNRLRGEIPGGGPFKNLTSFSVEMNEALCGPSQLLVKPCHDVSSENLRKNRRILIFVYVITGTILLVVVVVLFVLFKCRKKHQIPSRTDLPSAVTYERISHHELIQATNSFDESHLIGVGSFASVYKGIFPNGRICAVKVLNLTIERALRSFKTECAMLSSIRHRNLTKIITICSNPDFVALVLEYMPNGNLDEWLYSHNYVLDIKQRIDIMIDVASALDYLHHGCSVPVVHCDLKPSNILLDEDMVAHVCDFGIAKFLEKGSSAQTTTLATIGYTAPEYGREGLVSANSDVYSYGIMVMEVFTGKRPTDEMFHQDFSLKRWVNESLPNGIMQVIDEKLLRKDEYAVNSKVQCVLSILELASHCSVDSPDERISMKHALASLKKIKAQFFASLGW